MKHYTTAYKQYIKEAAFKKIMLERKLPNREHAWFNQIAFMALHLEPYVNTVISEGFGKDLFFPISSLLKETQICLE